MEDKVANPTTTQMQKVQNIKLDIHKSTAPAPTIIPSVNPKLENEYAIFHYQANFNFQIKL